MARIWNPSSSMRCRMRPDTRRFTASGLMMANVRSDIPRLYKTTSTAPCVRSGGLAHERRTLREGEPDALESMEALLTETSRPKPRDPAAHKGAIEGDRPTDEQLGNPHG